MGEVVLSEETVGPEKVRIFSIQPGVQAVSHPPNSARQLLSWLNRRSSIEVDCRASEPAGAKTFYTTGTNSFPQQSQSKTTAFHRQDFTYSHGMNHMEAGHFLNLLLRIPDSLIFPATHPLTTLLSTTFIVISPSLRFIYPS